MRLAALLGVQEEEQVEQVEQVHEEEQGASELLVVALRFRNLKDGVVMRAKKSERKTIYNNHDD